MVQHKMKHKTTLPKGVKAKVAKQQQKKAGVPRKGHALHIAPKKSMAVHEQKIGAEVTRIINEKNEVAVKNRANLAVGRNDKGEQPNNSKN